MLWLAATLVCIALGIYQVTMGWNGIPIQLGPIQFSMTIHPPLIICLWMVFWLGFWQGWWIGSLAQALVVNAPVLAILSRRLISGALIWGL